MSILIGKSYSTLSAYDVTNQQVSFDSFRNLNRSIDKSGQLYQFREKGSFELEFNYMTNSDYQSLSHILRNRNSMSDGLIFQPIPYAGAASTILDFNDSRHKGYYIGSTSNLINAGIPGGSAEFSSGDYNKIKVYNSDKIQYVGEHNNYVGFELIFDLSDFLSVFNYKELRRLTLVIHGMETTPVRFAILDQVSGIWFPINDCYAYAADLTDSAFYLYRQIVSSLCTPWATNTLYDNYIANDGKAHFMVVAAWPNEIMCLQYARLFINGYWVAEDEGGGFENYATAFTGAGRSGTLKLIEL
jgi:hypothetical protein